MRELTGHHDGHGLAESIRLEADEISQDRKHGGASHQYSAHIEGEDKWVLMVQFQKGPRGEVGSIPGVIDTVLLEIVRDRLRCFQEGPFPSSEGALALEYVTAAMHAMTDRADERAKRGVLGKAEQ